MGESGRGASGRAVNCVLSRWRRDVWRERERKKNKSVCGGKKGINGIISKLMLSLLVFFSFLA